LRVKNNSKDTYLSKTEIVYRTLKKNIIFGKLKPGERVKVEDIKQLLGVSSSPAREALKSLEAEGFLNNVPCVGSVVSEIDSKEIKEYYLIRANLEGLATELATPFIDKESINHLREILNKMEKCVQSNDYQEYSILDKKFHRFIYDISSYKKLQKMIYDLWNITQRFKIIFRLVPKRLSESYKEHTAIVEAIAQGKAKIAGLLVKKQQLKAGPYYIKLLDKHRKK